MLWQLPMRQPASERPGGGGQGDCPIMRGKMELQTGCDMLFLARPCEILKAGSCNLAGKGVADTHRAIFPSPLLSLSPHCTPFSHKPKVNFPKSTSSADGCQSPHLLVRPQGRGSWGVHCFRIVLKFAAVELSPLTSQKGIKETMFGV